MVKKLMDTVPDHLYPVVAGIEQFYDIETMSFEEVLSRLRAFDERSGGTVKLAGNDAMTSSFSRRSSGWLSRNRTRRSGGASTVAFAATSCGTTASRRRKRHCSSMSMRSRHYCEPGINPTLSCVCAAESSLSSMRV
jgi:hypothetical protein